MLGCVGIGAGQQEDVVGVVRLGGPHLLAVDDPLVAVELGPVFRLARSEPASGSLKPWHQEISPLRMPGMNCFLLLLGAPLQDRRAHQGVAEEVGPQRRPDPGELLVQHDLLEEGQALAAVLGGPAGADPTAGEELGRPLLVERGPFARASWRTPAYPTLRAGSPSSQALMTPRNSSASGGYVKSMQRHGTCPANHRATAAQCWDGQTSGGTMASVIEQCDAMPGRGHRVEGGVAMRRDEPPSSTTGTPRHALAG